VGVGMDLGYPYPYPKDEFVINASGSDRVAEVPTQVPAISHGHSSVCCVFRVLTALAPFLIYTFQLY
jgi:hypothetical protein